MLPDPVFLQLVPCFQCFAMLLAKQQEAQTERAYLEAWRDYWIARSELERAIGGKLGIETKPAFRDRLAKARGAFAGAIGSVLSRSNIDDETWDDLEEALLRADVGVGLTTDLLDSVRARVKDQGITEPKPSSTP